MVWPFFKKNIISKEEFYALVDSIKKSFSNVKNDISKIKENPKKIPKIDFVGANIPSISNYKRGFSTELAPYYSVEKYASKLVGILVKLRKSF